MYFSIVVSTSCLFHPLGTISLHLIVVVFAHPSLGSNVVILIISEAKCDCYIGQGILTLEGVLHVLFVG
jgi:hypothetical protein